MIALCDGLLKAPRAVLTKDTPRNLLGVKTMRWLILRVLGAASITALALLQLWHTWVDAIPVRAAERIVVRLESPSPPSDLWHQAVERFAALIRSRAEGLLDVAVFCCSQLSRDTVRQVEMVGSGAITGALIPATGVASYDERASIWLYPFIARSHEEYWSLLDSDWSRQLWREILMPRGITPIVEASTNQGFRQLTTRSRMVTRPEHLKGLRIRVTPSPLYIDLFRVLGANPVQMPFGDVFSALQQRTVDGQENPLPLIWSAGFHKLQDYLTIWNYSGNAMVFAFNTRFWNTLEPSLQRIFTEAAVEVAYWHRQAVVHADEVLVRELQGQLKEVVRLSEEDLLAFENATRPLYDLWAGRLGPELAAVLAESLR